MRVLIVAYELPYPANQGGKVDTWSRIQALKKLGMQIFLLTWHGIHREDVLSEDTLMKVNSTVDQLEVVNIPRDFKRVFRLLKYPSHVAARMLDKNSFNRVLKEVIIFNPDFVLIDGVYAGYTGLKFSRELSLPVCLRSHNIEHKYMLGQFKRASGFRAALSILANLSNLENFENKIFSTVDAYFDISLEDLNFWKRKGYVNGYWLPPIYLDKKKPVVLPEDLPFDEKYNVGFIGNLYTPNNVQGVLWFVDNVLPILKTAVPDIKILITGSNPAAVLRATCEQCTNIKLVANPVKLEPFIANTDILINPVRFGSGVNIKTIEMLFSSKQVVSTSVGIKGLPENIRDVFYIADSPQEYANHIIDIIKNSQQKDLLLRENLKKLFQEDAIDILLTVMRSKILEKEY